MEEILKHISDYGITIIIVALFIYAWWDDRKNRNVILDNSLKLESDNNEILSEMKNTNLNTAKSLELLQISMQNQLELLKQHDERQQQIHREMQSLGSKIGMKKGE